MWKRGFIFVVILTFVGFVVYACSLVPASELFFCIPLTAPEAPVSALRGGHYPLRNIHVRTPVTVDAKGRIYIVGSKDGKVQVVVVNKLGRIERVITPHWRDSRFLQWSFHISVSPSGNRIWTIEWDKDISAKKIVHRVSVHDREGKPEGEWLISGYGTSELLLNACSEHGAYVIASDVVCFYFEIEQKKPQEFEIPESFRPIYPIFFHDGKYWGMNKFDQLTQQIGEPESKKRIAKPEGRRNLFGIVTWSPQEGVQLISAVGFPARMNIQWIDEQGNFYDYRWGHYSVHLPSFLTRIPILIKMLKAFGIYEKVLKPISPQILIFSPKGKLLDVVPLSV
ncbi:MAG: hypothetical protein NZ937_03960 [Armatimonadetes bacterium]|nr:hypothetical protein [Armatimonadota bacterium]